MKNETSKKAESPKETERKVIKGFAGKDQPENTDTETPSDSTSKTPTAKSPRLKDRQENPLRNEPEHKGNTEWDKPEERNDPDHTQTEDAKTKRKI